MNLKSIIKQCVTEEINTPKWYLGENIQQKFIYPENFKSVRNYIRCIKRPDTNELIVAWYENGKINEDKSYFTDDNNDAIQTFNRMKLEVDKENSNEYSHAPEMRVRSDEPQNEIPEGFDPQSMGVNCPMQPGESINPYKAMNDKMRTMEEDNKKTGILSPKGLATVEKWATTMDSRLAAKRIIDSVLRNKLGLTSDDLADTSTFANGLDMIEDLLKTRDYQGAYDVAKDTADEMIEEEGGGEMDENKSANKKEKFDASYAFRLHQDSPKSADEYAKKHGLKFKVSGGTKSFEKINETYRKDDDYVEYVSQRQGEEPFTLRTGNGQGKFEYVNGKYSDGTTDIAVYAFRGDVCYGYNHFRKMFNLSESDITSVRPRDNGANIPREPEDAPNQYTKTNSDMSNMGNLEEGNHKVKCKVCGTPTFEEPPKSGGGYCPKCKHPVVVVPLEETLPSNFPNKLYRKLKSEYPNNDKTVYATARELSKKYGDKLNEIAEKSKCKCKNCGKLFEPHYGDYSKCPDCMDGK